MIFLSFLRSNALFFIIPGIATILSFILRAAAGHFWQHCDPSYMFLFNALHMVKHITPTYFDNPGTPLQILIFWIICLLNLGHSAADILIRVLQNPEFYLFITFTVLVIGSFVTSVMLAIFVYSKTQDKMAALLTQLPWLSFFALRAFETALPVLPVISNVDGEHMLVIFINLFNLGFLSLFFAKSPRQEFLAVIMLSIIAGLGLATKLTFASPVFIALLITPWPLKILFVLGFIFSFILGTLPIISKYPVMFHYFNSYSTHTGQYGTGTHEIINWPIYWNHLISIAQGYPFFTYLTLSLFVISTIQFILNPKDRNIQFLWVIVLGCLAHLLIVAKHFSYHYLLTGFGLFSSVGCIIYLQWIAKNKILKYILILGLFLFCAVSVYQTLKYSQAMSGLSRDINALNDRINSKYPNAIIIPTGTVAANIYITPLHGLFLGNFASLHKENDELALLYPHSYFFNTEMTEPGNREDGYGLRDFYGNRVFADDFLSAGVPVIFIKLGNDFSPNYGLDVRPIDQSQYVSAYLLEGSTEKEAYALFLEFQALAQQGQFPQAIAVGLKAKALHFQPEGKLNYYLSVVYQHLPTQNQ